MSGAVVFSVVAASLVGSVLAASIIVLRLRQAKLLALIAEADEIISRWTAWAAHSTELKKKSNAWLTRRREAMFDEPFNP